MTYVNKFNTKYPDYKNMNTHCKSHSTNDVAVVNPTSLDQIEDTSFFLQKHNYVNGKNYDGSPKFFSGVCNPKLLDKCTHTSNAGICNNLQYGFSNKILLDYNEPNSTNYKTILTTKTYDIQKLPSNSIIINNPDFARLYCESGVLKQEDGVFMCS